MPFPFVFFIIFRCWSFVRYCVRTYDFQTFHNGYSLFWTYKIRPFWSFLSFKTLKKYFINGIVIKKYFPKIFFFFSTIIILFYYIWFWSLCQIFTLLENETLLLKIVFSLSEEQFTLHNFLCRIKKICKKYLGA